MPPQNAAKSKAQDPKKLIAELQASNDQLTEELEVTKLELETMKQKMSTILVRLVEGTDQR